MNFGNNGTDMVMPVQPAGYGNYGGGYGFGDGGFIWPLIFILALMNGGWGGLGGFGWGGMMAGGMADGMWLYPWLNNSQNINGGFRDQQIGMQISDARTDINRGFGDLQLGIAGVNQNLCQTGSAITGAVRDGFSAAEIAANGRQMASMQQLFGIQSAQQACCCETREAIADTKFTIAQEACATRANSSDNTQRILDKLCQLELDGVRRELAAEQRDNANLRSDLQYARGQASQEAQSSDIVRRILTELRQCPVPSQPVYGNQPIFGCSPNYNGCGCGCGGNFGFAAA